LPQTKTRYITLLTIEDQNKWLQVIFIMLKIETQYVNDLYWQTGLQHLELYFEIQIFEFQSIIPNVANRFENPTNSKILTFEFENPNFQVCNFQWNQAIK